jgi:P-type Mg2+ transporter
LVLVCKGAFEEVVLLCTGVRHGPESHSKTPEFRQQLTQRAAAFNNDGYRVVVVVTKEVHESDLKDDDLFEDLDSRMAFEGLLTFLLPPKDDAAASIQRLQALGVEDLKSRF